jgi:hypothetical protein
MSLLLRLSGLALRQVVNGALYAIGREAGQSAVEPIADYLLGRLTDDSERLTEALRGANQQAWQALEASLAGNSIWEQLSRQLTAGDVLKFRTRVLELIDSLPPHDRAGLDAEEFRERSRTDLQRARHAGLLKQGTLDLPGVIRETARFASFGSTPEIVEAEWQSIEWIGRQMQQEDYPYLGRFILLRDRGWPLLAIASRYFLSKQLEKNDQLFRRMMLQREGGLTLRERAMVSEMHALLQAHGEKLDSLLDIGRRTLQNTEQALHDHQVMKELLAELLLEVKQLRQKTEAAPVVEVVEVMEVEEIVEVVEVPVLGEGEPVPEVPPRYVTELPAQESMDLTQSLPIHGELWSNPPASANPGAPTPEPEEKPRPRRGLPPLFDL